MVDSFDTVASVVGKHMDLAWKNIMTELSDVATGKKSHSEVAVLATGGPALVSQQIISDFFGQLGGASLAIDFSNRNAKGQVVKHSAYALDLTPAGTAAAAMSVEGSITIGGTIRF